MKTLISIIAILSIATLLRSQTEWMDPPDHYSLRRWESPDKKTIFFIKRDLKKPYLNDMLLQHGNEKPVEVKNIETDLSKEHGGHGWFPAARYKWLGERFLVFDRGDNLGVLDVGQARFLINNHFESLLRHPKEDKWIFVRYRGTYRHGGWEPDDFSDTLGLIALASEVLKPEKVAPLSDKEGFADATFLDHCKWIKLDGLMISPPTWTKDSAEIAFLQRINGKTYLCLHDGKTLKENKKTEVQVDVPREILESPALVDDLKPKVESLLKK